MTVLCQLADAALGAEESGALSRADAGVVVTLTLPHALSAIAINQGTLGYPHHCRSGAPVLGSHQGRFALES
jgi:hypothetical protein